MILQINTAVEDSSKDILTAFFMQGMKMNIRNVWY